MTIISGYLRWTGDCNRFAEFCVGLLTGIFWRWTLFWHTRGHFLVRMCKSSLKQCQIEWLASFTGFCKDYAKEYGKTHNAYVTGKPGICFHYYCAVYDECKYSDTFWLADRTRLLYSTPSHYHHCANLSEGIELIKCLSDIFCRVCE